MPLGDLGLAEQVLIVGCDEPSGSVCGVQKVAWYLRGTVEGNQRNLGFVVRDLLDATREHLADQLTDLSLGISRHLRRISPSRVSVASHLLGHRYSEGRFARGPVAYEQEKSESAQQDKHQERAESTLRVVLQILRTFDHGSTMPGRMMHGNEAVRRRPMWERRDVARCRARRSVGC